MINTNIITAEHMQLIISIFLKDRSILFSYSKTIYLSNF